jgi:hypothetical protein
MAIFTPAATTSGAFAAAGETRVALALGFAGLLAGLRYSQM